jgi:hypothetical protein
MVEKKVLFIVDWVIRICKAIKFIFSGKHTEDK